MALSEKFISSRFVDDVAKLPAVAPPGYEQVGIQRGGSSHPWGLATHALSSMLRVRPGKRAEIKVSIDGHFNSKIYTTNSEISGEVVISPLRSMQFHHVDIALAGTAHTRRDGPDITHTTTHRFLRLEMPVDDSEYPSSHVFEAGRTYTLPFVFNVPAHLTSQACTHRVSSDDIWERHMSLPPTVGGWEKDDMAPEMARIEYSIKAHVLKASKRGFVVAAESSHPVNVIPATSEEPPLNITGEDKLYALKKSRDVRKNMFSSVQGRISAVAAQPSAIRLGKEGHDASHTSIPISLTFEPTSADVVPPQFTSASLKIQGYTWFRDQPMQELPNLGTRAGSFAYPASVALPKVKPSVQWTQNVDMATDKAPIFHTATVEVPLRLPADKMFVPTFHACIVSRVYSVRVSLEGDAKVDVTVPLQVVMGSAEV
ncbi:hypothetical protein FZEAL_5267 [Fusarium zealandicum]|uniref:Arrestin-like N-terminal domain-containing protein n=1 Tax=Fusarium zealandicum TaxID=1053134 RepID=A0A8H4UKU3_9HYPO|nr:hypothetical protein FZEAL_5267 [Fusarium zealandicum]